MKKLNEVTCIVRMDENGEETAYINTGKTRQAYGRIYFVFVRMTIEPDFTDLWSISQAYFESEVESGRLRVAETFGDL